MKTSKRLIEKFEALKGAKFISVNNYIAKGSGEIANHVVNVNISVMNAKQNDLATLKACSDDVIQTINDTHNISTETVKLALSEMIASLTKNVSANKADRTAQSNGQTDAYVTLAPGVKFHKESGEISLFGQHISKTVIEAGEYADKKKVNSSDKTIAKKVITKELNLRAGKYRNYILGRIDQLNISGQAITC